MKRIGKSKGEEDTDIDITPMLDVVFIMLIFFIVTASFVKESAIPLNKPPAVDTPPENPDIQPIVVEVTDLSEIRIQNRLVDPRAVKPTIVRLKAESPESGVVVKVDPDAKTKAIMEAVDGIRDAKVFDSTISMKKS